MSSPSNGRRVALVTGANKGIGHAIARGLAKQGITVLLGSRDAARGEAAAARLAGDGLDVRAVVLDVTRQDTIASAASRIGAEQGKLDILVNNAGIALEWQSKPSNVDLRLVKQVYETNVFGVMAVTQAMLPLLLRSEAGRVVNVSSTLGSLCLTSDAANPVSKFLLLGYNTSKTALNAVTVQFANELRETSVKVNCVCPGYVATDMNHHSGPRTPEQGAEIAIQLATIPDDGPTGGYFDENGRVPW